MHRSVTRQRRTARPQHASKAAKPAEAWRYSTLLPPDATWEQRRRKLIGDLAFGLAGWSAFAWLVLAYLGVV